MDPQDIPDMKKMFKTFMKAMKQPESSGDSSDDDKKKQERREANLAKRPSVMSNHDFVISAKAGQYACSDIKVQNQTRWPCPLRSIRKIGGSDDIVFEDIEIDQKLKYEDEAKFSIPVQMPFKAGDYVLKLGFFGNKGTHTGQPVVLKYDVSE